MLDELIVELEASVGTSNSKVSTAKKGEANGGEKKSGGKKGGDDVSAPQNAKKEKKEKKEKGGGGETNTKPQSNEPSVNLLELRVGVITSVKKHETADKLYCEEIDIGEAEPRQIASGLVPHYTLEEMEGRRLIVVANLKPRNLVGFKSSGMVLCAAKPQEDGSEKVEFVDPPAEAKPGDRIIGTGLDLVDPLSPSQEAKQKMFLKVGELLKVNEKGEATWNGAVLTTEAGGVCTAPTLRDAVMR